MKSIPWFEPGLFQLLFLHTEKPESNMQSHHQDPGDVSPLAMHISLKLGQDWWFYVCNPIEVFRERYPSPVKTADLKLSPGFCFRSYRRKTQESGYTF